MKFICLRRILLLVIAGFCAFSGYSQLYINEFSASNNSIIYDEEGDYDDWIEVYNSSDVPVDIGGMFLTDSLGFPSRHQIPTTNPGLTTISAKGFVLLWADGQEEQGLLHLNFRLSKDGGQIGIAAFDGVTIIDTVTYTKQYTNSSLSRYPDGNATWIYPPPTPGGKNMLPSVSELYINEFCTSNINIITDEFGDYDDWIEIYNANDAPVDIGGLFLTDTLPDPVKYRISSSHPELTTIPARGYILLWADNQEEQGVLHIDFKFGRDGEQIGLTGYDGITFIDSLTYSRQYTNSSLSRFPDGSDLLINPPPTPGETNALPAISGIFINEFCASNISIIPDKQGDYDDWIEIYNANDTPVDIGGLYLTDNLSDPARYRIPTTCPDSTTLPAGSYILLWADNQEEQGVLHTGFKLGRNGEQIGLTGFDEITFIDSITYDKQYTNSSMSRFPDGYDRWVYAPSTPGSQNNQFETEGIIINEFMPDNENIIPDESGEFDDWIEIYNSNNKPIDVGGFFVTDSLGEPARYRIPSTCPDSTTIPANGYILLWADGQEEQGILHLDFKLSKSGEAVGLSVTQPDGVLFIDSVTYGPGVSGKNSFSRIPDGTGDWFSRATPTPFHPNIISSAGSNFLIRCKLQQNMPNPFNRSTVIEYSLNVPVQNAQINIFDLSGIKLRSIPLTIPGYGYVIIDGNDLRPGTYIYNLVVDGQVINTRKMILTE